MSSMENKVALVAGGAGGIGADICRLLAEEGGRVIVGDPNVKGGEALVESLKQDGFDAFFYALDAADEESWNSIVDAAKEKFGRVDVLITAFWGGKVGTMGEMTPKEFADAFEVTAFGVYTGMYAIQKVMPKGGSIVNISSIASHAGSMDNAAYAAAKAAVNHMDVVGAAKFAERGVRVNTVTPGFIQTAALDHVLDKYAELLGSKEAAREVFLRGVPLREIGEPRDISEAVVFLSSDRAKYITGAEIIVDGGYMTLN